MAEFAYGNMWDVFPTVDLFLITTNSHLRRDGALVMGRGIARQARDRFKGLDAALGKVIAQVCGSGNFYHLIVSPAWPTRKLGIFQVKLHYAADADLAIIEHSVAALTEWCATHPTAKVALNFPGIGAGHLAVDTVMPIVSRLPHNVTLWRYR